MSETAAARAAVAAALVAYGAELAEQGAAQVGDAFTDLAGADALIKESPDAFLLGVLFTQGIPAERAWAGPYLLRERLGHLDLERLATDRSAVDEAVCRAPALHRFKHTAAGWIGDAAELLLRDWGGDASALWADRPSAVVLTERLSGFSGIGRKKAAMAVEILVRHFGVAIDGLECGSVAYDVHVRRVFLRTGLVDVDTPERVAAAAAEACPRAPGSLDLPTWLVGRQWCHPKGPLCRECRMGGVCPYLVDRNVEGVGARRSAAPPA